MEGGGNLHKTFEVSLNLGILKFYKHEEESKSVSNKVSYYSVMAIYCLSSTTTLFHSWRVFLFLKNQKNFSKYLMLEI